MGISSALDSVKLVALPAQKLVLKSTLRYVLFVAGYGSGKSQALIYCAVTDVLRFPGVRVGVYAPTFDQLKLNLIPRITEFLDSVGFKYKLNKSAYIIYIENGSEIVLRSLDNPSRIIGYETVRSYIDELDILALEHAEDVWNKVIARTREVFEGCTNRIWAFTTPEGYRFCHKRWVKLGGKDYGIIKAKTADNKFLPDDYVQALYDTYPPQLAKAYLEGEFVNLTSGSVYDNFNRKKNHQSITIDKHEKLFVGMDFNIYHMAAVIYVERVIDGKKGLVAAGELFDIVDTERLCNLIREIYPKNYITVIPDATGKRGQSSAGAGESDHAIIKRSCYGFNLRVKSANPRIKDRVAAVNGGFAHGTLWVDTDKCPELTTQYEQQVYDKNGLPDKAQGNDHIIDASGYPIAELYPIRERKVQLSVVAL